MLTELFPRMHRRYSSLPLLGPILGDFAAWIVAQGYAPVAVRRHLRAARHLDQRWRRRGRRSLDAVRRDDLRVCAPGHSQDDADLAAGARQLERYLEVRGLLPRRAMSTPPPEVAEYRTYLTELRGLAPSTVVQHVATAAQLLQHLAKTTPPTPLPLLTSVAIDHFVEAMSARLTRASLQHTVAHLRSFLRWLGAHRRVPSGLDTQIDTPRVYRREQLPRALAWDTVWALLRSIDRTTALGRRDYAMLLLIATYGLRTSEVVALTLDDIGWRRSEVRIPRRKVEGALLLPLTDHVGAALLEYLQQGRPSQATRVVFLRHRPPPGILKPTAVTDVFQARVRRSGLPIPFHGPHCLRHSLAVRLLRQGVSLKAIGDVLGHRSAESTCMYLRLAVEDLQGVALNLPRCDTAVTAKGGTR